MSYNLNKIIIFLCFLPFFLLSQPNSFFPTCNGELVHHTYYSLSYSEEHEQAEWVFYIKNHLNNLGQVSRSNNFKVDNKVSTNSATLSDYKKSGYDRGHLAPAADFSFNSVAMSESFYMSNMSPQIASFNRGVWKKLESLVRYWGEDNTLCVVAGPVLNNCVETIGGSNVCVPKSYYKVIYDPLKERMIAFCLPNEKGEKDLDAYVCSVDSLEEVINIDFFPSLKDGLEEKLESEIEKGLWDWSRE